MLTSGSVTFDWALAEWPRDTAAAAASHARLTPQVS